MTTRVAAPSWLTREKLERAAKAAGGIRVAEVKSDANGVTNARLVFPDSDPWAAASFLVAVAKEDLGDPMVWRVGLALSAVSASDVDYAARVQAWVQKNIRFQKEPVETFQSSRYTIETRVGDCDCHARLVYALLGVRGIEARFAFLADKDGLPRHVWTQAHVARVWADLETTIPANFAETPLVAAKRLGLRTRTDLVDDGGVRTMAGVAATGETTVGVDLATFAGVVDWPTLAKGVGFALVRTGDGLGQDARFVQNWQGAKAAGIVRGAWQFFRASLDPVAQADLMSKQVGSLGILDLPPACDLEVADGVDLAGIPDAVLKWGARIQANLGVTPMLYTDPGFYDSLPKSALDGAWPLWVANVGVKAPTLPRGFSSWVLWQYKWNQAVPGAANVDLDVFNGSALALKAFAAKKAWAPLAGASDGSGGESSGPPGSSALPPSPATNDAKGGCDDGDG
jgi:lysozyme